MSSDQILPELVHIQTIFLAIFTMKKNNIEIAWSFMFPMESRPREIAEGTQDHPISSVYGKLV